MFKEIDKNFHNSSYNVEKIISNLNFHYEKEKSFSDLRDKRRLKFDFYLPKTKTLIEFQGIQHYQYFSAYHKSRLEFEDQRKKDNMKRKYCDEKGLKLIEIPFWLKNDEIEKLIIREVTINYIDQDKMLPFIEDFVLLNYHNTIYMNQYYELYLKMLKSLKKNITINYELFKQFIIHHLNLTYKGIIKEDDDNYYEVFVTQSS